VLAEGSADAQPIPSQSFIAALTAGTFASLAPLSIRLHVVPGGPSARANGATTCVYPLPDSRFRLHATSSPRPWHRRHHSVTHPGPLMGPSPNRPSHQKGWGETCPSCALKPYGQCQPTALAPPARTQTNLQLLSQGNEKFNRRQRVGKQEHVYIE
jgi:hypothetical protein